MRVVHVYKDYYPPVHGGIEQTIERMARGLVGVGAEVTVLTSAHRGRRTIDERVDGVRVVRVAEWGRVLSAPLCPSMPAHLARLKADLFHLHFPNPTGEVSWLAVRPKGALVVSYYSDIVRQAAALPIYGFFVDALLRRSDLILATSDRHLQHSAYLRRFADKCSVLPLGIDLQRFAGMERYRAQAEALRARFRPPLILFVGRLRYYKGLDVLLRAMPHVAGRLLVVGDGPEGPRLRDLHASLGLGDRATFVGPVDEGALLAHLAAADVGVLPSTYPSEVFGLALIEMMACGMPVISTELGTGTSFVNLDEQTGLVVPPRDPAALARALNRLLADPALRRQFGEAGRRRAHEMFSESAMISGLQRAYDLALTRYGSKSP